ncbi:MAG: hypothetical protein IJA84_00810 [Clostridia bacterium]|nr:hypothetical protein [Clostridia bacterium]
MNLVFFLKILVDLCYYGTYAAFFASIYGLTGSLLPQFGLLSLAAALSRAAHLRYPETPLRRLPLLLCPLAFVLPTQTAGLVILAPAALYVLFCCVTERTQPRYYDSIDIFFLELKLLFFPALLTVGLAQWKRAEAFSAPYLLVFLLGSVLLLRMLRHDEATLSQPRFRLMNGLSMAGLCLACGFLGSPLFRKAAGLVLKAVWRVVSIPILVVLGGVGMGMAWVLEAVLPDELTFEGFKQEPLQYLYETEETQPQITPEPNEELTRVVMLVISGLLIALAVLAAVLLFRRLLASRRGESASGPEQHRFAASAMPPPQRPLTRLSARTPELQVRYWYQQLLHKTRREGGDLRPSMDTRQQSRTEDGTFPQKQPEIARLRQLYLPARYKGQATAEDAREAKDLYHRIKKD